jgi:hypothetical protein
MKLKQNGGLSAIQVFDEVDVFLGGGGAVDGLEDMMSGGLFPSACPMLREFRAVTLMESRDAER